MAKVIGHFSGLAQRAGERWTRRVARWMSGGPGLSYNRHMDDRRHLSPLEVAQSRERRLAAMRLQEIEGNPLNADDVAMFEMFERNSWPPERCRSFILSQAVKLAAE
jgi:hypothetical protein